MTNSGEDQPVHDEALERSFIVSDDEMNRIVASLSVAHGYVQLARRHMLQDPTSGSELLHRALARMEECTRAMAAELWGIMGAPSRSTGHADPD